MFQFPRFPLPALCVQAGVPIHDDWRVSPFGYLRIKAWSTAPRSFSQPPTSFIGSRRQGIHRWHFIAWNIKDARARYRDFKDRLQPGSDCRRGVQNGPTASHIDAGRRYRGVEPNGCTFKTKQRACWSTSSHERQCLDHGVREAQRVRDQHKSRSLGMRDPCDSLERR